MKTNLPLKGGGGGGKKKEKEEEKEISVSAAEWQIPSPQIRPPAIRQR